METTMGSATKGITSIQGQHTDAARGGAGRRMPLMVCRLYSSHVCGSCCHLLAFMFPLPPVLASLFRRTICARLVARSVTCISRRRTQHHMSQITAHTQCHYTGSTRTSETEGEQHGGMTCGMQSCETAMRGIMVRTSMFRMLRSCSCHHSIVLLCLLLR